MNFCIPGKTFLVGEYAVLVEGEALCIATEPCFRVHSQKSLSEKSIFHGESAAGLLLKKNNISGSSINCQIKNPYGQGGFGYSTAEFIAIWFNLNKSTLVEGLSDNDIDRIFNNYQELYLDGNSNQRPSGADLVSMIKGKVTHFKPNVSDSYSNDWVFNDLSFVIISTGLKIKTHEHLATLDRSQLGELKSKSSQSIQNYLLNKRELFLKSLSEWSQLLNEKGLQHKNSWSFKLDFEKNHPEILLAKPNGALGADTMTLFFDPKDLNRIKEILKLKNINIIATEKNISRGIHYVD